MNRTLLFLAVAGVLALSALLLGPGVGGKSGPTVATPDPVLTPTLSPTPAANAAGSLSYLARLSHPLVMSGTSEVYVTVDVTGQEVPGMERTPVNLALVIDRSGSMSGYKLQQAKLAARHLIRQLGERDRLAIVHYGSDVAALSSRPADASGREQMLSYVDAIYDDGGTNISAGLSSGLDQVLAQAKAFKVNRVILISDGQPTEGVTHDSGLTAQVRSMRAAGVTVSSLGVGSDFNEDLMQAFAEVGSGAYGFIDDAAKLASLFQKDLQRAATTVARGVELSFTLPEGVELAEVLGYEARQQNGSVAISLPDFSAGQLERVVARLRVTAPKAGTSFDVAGVRLAFRDLLAEKPVELASSLRATSSDVHAEVVAKQDKEATVYAARSVSAQNLERAAEMLEEGRKEEAQVLLQKNEAIFQEAAGIAGSQAVAKDLSQQRSMMDAVRDALTDEDLRVQTKSTKAASRRGYGKIGSTY